MPDRWVNRAIDFSGLVGNYVNMSAVIDSKLRGMEGRCIGVRDVFPGCIEVMFDYGMSMVMTVDDMSEWRFSISADSNVCPPIFQQSVEEVDA